MIGTLRNYARICILSAYLLLRFDSKTSTLFVLSLSLSLSLSVHVLITLFVFSVVGVSLGGWCGVQKDLLLRWV